VLPLQATDTITVDNGQIGLSTILASAVSPDGTRALSGTSDGKVRLWDIATGTLIHTFTEHRFDENDIYRGVSAVAFSPNGNVILTGTVSGSMRVWDATTLEQKYAFRAAYNDIVAINFSPNGNSFITASAEGARVWNISNGEMIYHADDHQGWVLYADFSPDGTTFLSSSTDKTVLWSSATGEKIREFDTFIGGTFSFSPNGELLIGSYKMFTVETGEEYRDFELTLGKVSHTKFLPDGTTFVGSRNDSIMLFNYENESVISLLGKHGTLVRTIGVGTSVPMLVSHSKDQTMKIWNYDTQEEVREINGFSNDIIDFDISPNGELAIIGEPSGEVSLYNTETGAMVFQSKLSDRSYDSVRVSFVDGGDAFFTTCGTKIIFWDCTTFDTLSELSAAESSITSITTAKSDSIVIFNSSWGKLLLWNRYTDQLDSIDRTLGDIYQIVVSPDESSFAVASENETVTLYDLATLDTLLLFTGHSDEVFSVAYTSDGSEILSGGFYGEIHRWNTSTGEIIQSYDEHRYRVTSIDISDDDTRFVSSGIDRTIREWNIESGEVLGLYDAHLFWVTEVHYMNDDRELISSSLDGSLRLWEIPKPSSLTPLYSNGTVTNSIVKNSIVKSSGKTLTLSLPPLENSSGEVSYTLFNLSGSVMHHFTTSQRGTIQIEQPSYLSAGVYFYLISGVMHESITGKLLLK